MDNTPHATVNESQNQWLWIQLPIPKLGQGIWIFKPRIAISEIGYKSFLIILSLASANDWEASVNYKPASYSSCSQTTVALVYFKFDLIVSCSYCGITDSMDSVRELQRQRDYSQEYTFDRYFE